MTEMPADIALLWGLREAPRRGRRPTLTAADVTKAAIAVADAEGLGAVSMARVAAELGNSTMALYRYVKSKDELLTLMSDAALDDPPELPADGDWRAGITLLARSMLDVWRRHPWYVQLPVNGPPAGPRNLQWFDRLLSALADTPLDEGEQVGVVMGLLTFVHGEMRLRSELAAGYRNNPESFGRAYAAALRRLVDPREMPALRRIVDAGVFDVDSLHDEPDLDADFTATLNRYLDGVAAHMARRAQGRSQSMGGNSR
ncbi:TetR/AcrR family transcriptional regulator [Saccharothrix sp.]|uniref:TetR/AcrR family transcriptional regulator n=1 Tax=Saccharothrix sp. TaxID=1873460 RepID=UPI002811E2F9|nr:TetR/AcrR family transcriptional regulator [Saccharothrix sp.]